MKNIQKSLLAALIVAGYAVNTQAAVTGQVDVKLNISTGCTVGGSQTEGNMNENGDHYSGQPIPDHHTRPEFKAPEIDWTPVISPSSLIIYRGQQFPAWQNKALIGGLSSEAIVVVDLEHKPVKEVQRLEMKQRIRGLHEAQDGSIWVIEDGPNARLLKLSKKPS